MVSLGYDDPGPKCDNLPLEVKNPEFSQLCRALGIEPGDTWVLEVSHEGMLQFTRPLTQEEKTKYLKVAPE